MKKLALTVLATISLALMACGPSKLEIQEASSMSDVLIEVRQVLNDSISLYVGNVFYLNSKQIVADDMYPLHASTRDPSEFEKFTDGTNSRVDHYDNCIAYNDHVLSVLYNEAIKNPDFMSFTFLSGHGEDPEKGITHEVSKFTWHMAHIPLLTIFSDKFAQNHPEIIATLNEHNNSYWTSDLLYNTMITLMGIKNSPDERPDFDIASPDYNMTPDKLTVVEGTYSVKDDDIDKN